MEGHICSFHIRRHNMECQKRVFDVNVLYKLCQTCFFATYVNGQFIIMSGMSS